MTVVVPEAGTNIWQAALVISAHRDVTKSRVWELSGFGALFLKVVQGANECGHSGTEPWKGFALEPFHYIFLKVIFPTLVKCFENPHSTSTSCFHSLAFNLLLNLKRGPQKKSNVPGV